MYTDAPDILHASPKHLILFCAYIIPAVNVSNCTRHLLAVCICISEFNAGKRIISLFLNESAVKCRPDFEHFSTTC